MKKLAVFYLVLAPVFAASNEGAMNSAERAYLIEQLEQTKQNMLASISGLSDAQWRFKPAPTVWSVRECAEHIILAEGFLFGIEQMAMKAPAVERAASATLDRDQAMFASILDRSKKLTAPEPITPSGKFATPEEAIREFTKARDHSLEYVRTTSDELRVHVAKGPAGNMDGYQFLLAMAAHSARHTLQIREVEANARYPRSTSVKSHFLVTYTLAHGDFSQVTREQMVVLMQHAAYVKTEVEQGRITWGGRTVDPKHPRGLAVYEASSEDEVRGYVLHDPAVTNGVFQWTIEGFSELTREASMSGSR
ncbi:MAG TPA: DinB family protein [Bryobacteraceae bacterium]|nr:DinB family protein [Bryobacteraceae bacterium]